MPEFKFLVRVEDVEGLENIEITFYATMINIMNRIDAFVTENFEEKKALSINDHLSSITANNSMIVYEHGQSFEKTHEFVPNKYMKIEKSDTTPDNNIYDLTNGGMIIMKLDARKKYHMIIRKRGRRFYSTFFTYLLY
jgi:hypothetical protein